jgi:hypothetical protein
MRIWTVHMMRAGVAGRVADPVLLVREGFAWGACLFGPFWLLRHGLWLAALGWVVLALGFLLLAGRLGGPLLLGLCLVTGAQGRDLLRRRLARRYADIGVVAAPTEDAALARLLAERPDLAAPLARSALA